MSTILSENFTGSNGTLWTALGFTKVHGGAGDAIIGSNMGEAGGTATERIYQVAGYPGLPNYKLQALFTWLNAVGAGRVHGLGLRVTADGLYGYLLEVDSNINAARARIRKIVNGSFSDVVAWTSISGTVTGAQLNAGATLLFRVENTDASTVTFECKVNGTEILAGSTHTGAAAIFSGGSGAVVIGPNCTGTDVTTDDLVMLDFEDENSASPALGTGLDLVIDGTHYTQAEWAALGISVDGAIASYDVVPAITLHDTKQYTAPALSSGMVVQVSSGGTVITSGIIRRTTHNLTGQEGSSYEVTGWHELASEVPIKDPTTNAQFGVHNARVGSEYYRADRVGKELGEIIAFVIDNHLDGDGNLRDVGAAPASGAAYVQAELDALDFVGNEVNWSGTVLQAVESLLSYMPSYAVFIDPATKVWSFRHRPTLSTKDADLAAAHIEGSIEEDPGSNSTKVRVTGTRPEATSEALSVLGAGVVEAWQPGLEATHNQDTRHTTKDSGTVSSIGTDAGFLTMTPTGMTMLANEWKRCKLTFTGGAESGNEYHVQSNTTGTFKFYETAWESGGPAATDPFDVEGDADSPDGLPAGQNAVGRVYELADADKGLRGGSCVFVMYEHTLPDGRVAQIPIKGKIKTPDNVNLPSRIELGLPSIALFNPIGDPAQNLACVDDTPLDMATDVQVTVPTYSRSSPLVPTFDEPALGFRGTAYTVDSAKWNGAGQNGVGDPGNKRILPWSAPGYQDSTDEAAYRLAAAAILELHGTLNRNVRLVIAGIDTSWADLDWRLTLSNTGGDATGEESATDLWPLAVEYDFNAWSTTLVVGTLGNREYDLEALRERYVGESTSERNKRMIEDFAEMMECLNSVVNGGGIQQGAESPLGVCAENVIVRNETTNTSKSLKTKLLEIVGVLEHIGDLLVAEKGVVDLDGSIWFEDDGQWVYSEDGGLTWLDDLDNLGPEALDPAGGAAPGDQPAVSGPPVPGSLDDLHGLEGALWEAIQGLAANLGKTLDVVTGEVLTPGDTVGANGAIQFGPGGPVTIPEGGTVPPTTMGGALGNLEKTQDANDGPDGGVLLSSGAAVGSGGAGAGIYHSENNSGAYQALAIPNGGTAPANTSAQLQNVVANSFGLSIQDREDPIGIVWSG